MEYAVNSLQVDLFDNLVLVYLIMQPPHFDQVELTVRSEAALEDIAALHIIRAGRKIVKAASVVWLDLLRQPEAPISVRQFILLDLVHANSRFNIALAVIEKMMQGWYLLNRGYVLFREIKNDGPTLDGYLKRVASFKDFFFIEVHVRVGMQGIQG